MRVSASRFKRATLLAGDVRAKGNTMDTEINSIRNSSIDLWQHFIFGMQHCKVYVGFKKYTVVINKTQTLVFQSDDSVSHASAGPRNYVGHMVGK